MTFDIESFAQPSDWRTWDSLALVILSPSTALSIHSAKNRSPRRGVEMFRGAQHDTLKLLFGHPLNRLPADFGSYPFFGQDL